MLVDLRFGLLQLVQHAAQLLLIHARQILQGDQGGLQAFEFLEDLVLQIAPGQQFEDLDEAEDAVTTVPDRKAAQRVAGLPEKVFESQKRAHPLVERLFIDDGVFHGRRRPVWERKILRQMTRFGNCPDQTSESPSSSRAISR